MRKSIKIARIVQLVGAVLLILGIVSCSQREGAMTLQFVLGFLLIVGAKTYEWLKKE